MKPTLERIAELNTGAVEAKNLMETLAIDIHQLLSMTFSSISLAPFPEKTGIISRLKLTADCFYDLYGFHAFDMLKNHSSDTIRSISCFLLAKEAVVNPISFSQILDLIHPLANDSNSGVREWSWIALRPYVISDPLVAIRDLKSWGIHSSDNIRRYASEITRPRGVWCAHIKPLRESPWLAMELLERLKADPAKYVQLSVGNWLNDAGKDHPLWVQELCSRWERESPVSETQKICKRALRRFIKS